MTRPKQKKKNQKKKGRFNLFFEETKSNPFMKTLKVIEEISVEHESYLFFKRGGTIYAVSMEFGPFIYKVSLEDETFSLAEELIKEDVYWDVLDALRTKRESRVMTGNYIDVEGWSEIEEIRFMSMEEFEEKLKYVAELEEGDEEVFDEYLRNEKNFYPSDFQREFPQLSETIKKLILLVPKLQQFDKQYRQEHEDNTLEEEFFVNDNAGTAFIEYVLDIELEPASAFKEKIENAREQDKQVKAKTKVSNQVKHPFDVFIELNNKEKHLLHEEARAVYKAVRATYPEDISKELLDEAAHILFERAEFAGLNITLGQVKSYYNNNKKNLEKGFKKTMECDK